MAAAGIAAVAAAVPGTKESSLAPLVASNKQRKILAVSAMAT